MHRSMQCPSLCLPLHLSWHERVCAPLHQQHWVFHLRQQVPRAWTLQLRAGEAGNLA